MARKTHNKKGILTIEQAVKDFLTQSKAKLKESTLSRYSFICERHIIPYFQGMDIDKLNSKSINNFAQDKLNNGGLNGKPISPKTINDITCLLLQIAKKYSKQDVSIDRLI